MTKKALILGAALAGIVSVANADHHEKKAAPAKAEALGECHGINSCKGKGQCGSSDKADTHGCAGKNSCKGKGWEKTSEADCKTKKGQWKAST